MAHSEPSFGAYIFFALIIIVFSSFGLLFLFRPDVVAEFENTRTPWGKQYATAKQKGLSLARQIHIRMMGFGMTVGAVTLVLSLTGIIHSDKTSVNPQTPFAVFAFFFLVLFLFFCIGILAIFRPELIMNYEDNYSFWSKIFAAQNWKMNDFFRLFQIRLLGVIFTGFSIFAFFSVTGVIQWLFPDGK